MIWGVFMEKIFDLKSFPTIYKLIWLLIITIVGSIDYKPFLAISLIVIGIIIANTWTEFKAKEVLKTTWFFWIMSISFMIITGATRMISGQSVDLNIVLALGLRIIVISFYSALFVKTTEPSDFVITLIQYLKLSPRLGYSFLTAYRFLPTFKDELRTIKYAHQVRGVNESKNIFIKVWQIKRYTIPMLATAIRKGIRISMAMESRGFGKSKERTYIKVCTIEKRDSVYFTFSIVILMLIICILYYFGAIDIGLVYKG